jgi:DNA topoisomerase 2-associated protein PAT1
MSFFGLEQDDLLEREKQAYLEQQRLGGHSQGQGQRLGGGHGDVPEYTWGEDSYDGLADQLIEGGDDFNDETFGGSGPVGEYAKRMTVGTILMS